MSECVVRMEMPENCECCPMVYTADVKGYHWCAALEQEVEQGLNRPKGWWESNYHEDNLNWEINECR